MPNSPRNRPLGYLPTKRAPAAMSVRNPLGRAEAEVNSLRNELELLRHANARQESRFRCATKAVYTLQRRNAQLAVALQQKSGVVARIKSGAMWTKEVTVLFEFCKRWQADDLPELFCRLLNYRLRTSDVRNEPMLLTLTDREGACFDALRKAMYRERDWQIAAHLQQAWSPEKVNTARLCVAMSFNQAMWWESLLKYNWGSDAAGNRTKEALMLAPDSEVPVVCPISCARMRELQVGVLDNEAGNEQSADGRCAQVRSVDHTFLRLVKTTPRSTTGGWATKGTKDDPHKIILSLDGAGLTEEDSGVRLVAVPGSVENMNQSRAVYFCVNYLIFFGGSQMLLNTIQERNPSSQYFFPIITSQN